MKLGKVAIIGYDGNKHRKGCKVHAAVESLPLSIGPGDDSKRFIEVLGRISIKLEGQSIGLKNYMQLTTQRR